LRDMIRREALNTVQRRLNQFDSVALLGPRQAGKTTLAREISSQAGDAARYLDLESPSDRRRLDDPEAYFSAYAEKLIILDEIQRAPEIFQILRGQIDRRRRMDGKGGKFLILGSASMELLRQSSESLAGRISFIELAPLNLREVVKHEDDDITAITNALWLRGGFPESYLRDDDAVSLQCRRE